MKRILTIAASMLLVLIITNSAKAQAWDRDSKVLSLGVGGANFLHFDPRGYYKYGYAYSNFTGQLNFQGEFAIHKYVGLGFTTGVGGAGPLGRYYSEVNMPIGFIANFHFYQLIADKSSRNIHADKLDIYAGLNVGSGFAAVYYNPDGRFYLHPIFFAGPQVGIRYYFVPNVALNAELGYGKSWANIGFSFKL
jgi:hypothetical protein